VHRVNARIKNTRGNRGVTRRPRSEPGRYLFVGAIRCGHRGKSMFGNSAKSKAYYPCSATRPDYVGSHASLRLGDGETEEAHALHDVDDLGWVTTLVLPVARNRSDVLAYELL
jgi:hypothetical protein